jgi:SAM-dependent methyltransferase
MGHETNRVPDVCDAVGELKTYVSLRDSELKDFRIPSWNSQWFFFDRKIARGEGANYNFYGFDGPDHLVKFFNWLAPMKFHHYLDTDRIGALSEISLQRDKDVSRGLGIKIAEQALTNVALYNAQDYCFQRLYPVPDRQTPRRILEIGSGHGRLANLLFGASDTNTEFFVSLDAIPAPYLTQRLYYRALGLRVFDYVFDAPGAQALDLANMAREFDILHLPTWRIDLLPDNWFDMISCIQVLKELPPELVINLLPHFWRALKPGGALYIRDHLQFHNPNQLPHEELLRANGFVMEYCPHVVDRRDVWGIPRIYRKLDPAVYLDCYVQKRS